MILTICHLYVFLELCAQKFRGSVQHTQILFELIYALMLTTRTTLQFVEQSKTFLIKTRFL